MSDPKSASLPLESDAIVKLAARSMFELFSNMAQGMMLVDRAGRVVWINEAYKKFLPALGFERSGRAGNSGPGVLRCSADAASLVAPSGRMG